jgi:Ca2+-binding RTX toxin-like protein
MTAGRSRGMRMMVAAVFGATPLVLTAVASHAGSVYRTAIVVTGAWETRVGPDGSYYVAGEAPVGGMRTTPGAYVEPHSNGRGAFVSRYDPTGHLVWQVTLGGNARAGADALAIGRDGSVYVSGTVAIPTAFPTTPGALSRDYAAPEQSNFAAEISADGTTLEYGTILPGVFSVTDMEVDDAGHAVLTGGASDDLPTTPGAFQTADPVDPAAALPAYVAELSPSGSSYHWASYLGGANDTLASQVEIGPGDEVVVGGKALGSDFPTTSGTVSTGVHGYGDAFVAVLSSNGQDLVAGATFGGTETDDERPGGMAVQGDSVWLEGITNATDFPTTANAWFPAKPAGFHTAAWLAKLPLSLDSFDFSTYLPEHGAGEVHPAPGGDAVVELGDNPSPDFPRPGDDIGSGAGFLYLSPDGALDDVTIVADAPFDFDVDGAGSIYTATWGTASARAVARGTSRRATLGRNAHCTITGTKGADVLRGGPGPDVICGRGGDDVLIGNGSYDVLRGGPGSDLVRGGRGIDVLVGGPGNDVLAGGGRRDLVVGGSGADRLVGDAGPDLLRGGVGRDLLNGGSGHDRCGDPQRSTRYSHCENQG